VTGAGTYAQLKASLDSELARSRRYGRPVACLMFGFDDYRACATSSAATPATGTCRGW
jgi:GGDEF domain-containing protein